MDKVYLLAVLNLLACGVIFFVTVCRLNAITHRTLYRVRWEYALMNAASIASAISPWYGEWPGYAQLLMALAILMGLLASSHVWRSQGDNCDVAPPRTDRMPLQ